VSIGQHRSDVRRERSRRGAEAQGTLTIKQRVKRRMTRYEENIVLLNDGLGIPSAERRLLKKSLLKSRPQSQIWMSTVNMTSNRQKPHNGPYETPLMQVGATRMQSSLLFQVCNECESQIESAFR